MKAKFPKSLRQGGSSNIFASLVAIVVGLFVGYIILLITNPSQATGGFVAILTGGFSDKKSMGQVLYYATPILMTGLSVSFANKTGLFNIGASGQFIVGAYAAILVGVKCSFIPGHLLWICALLAALLAGAIWGAVPGFLKAFFNVNEVIACIMMNYVGMYLVNYLITLTVYDKLKNQSMAVASNANIPKMGLDQFFRNGNSFSSVGGGIFIAIIFAIIIYIVLEKTTFGFELKACGLNRDSAKYAGVNEKKSIFLSMVIAGAMAGLGGALLFLAGAGKCIDVVDTLAAEGFNGIPVALLALNNPIGVIFTSIFVAYLTVGGFNMQLYDFAPQVIEIIIAVIIYFSAFSLLLKGYLEKLAKRRKKTATSGAAELEAPDASAEIEEEANQE